MRGEELLHGVGIGAVGLVEHEQLGDGLGADLEEHRVHGRDLALGLVEVGRVDDVEEQRGVDDLVERRAERLDELVREPPHEADGVGREDRLAAREVHLPDGRVEGGEETVLDEHVGVRQPVQQRRLPGVRVADERDRGAGSPPASLALGGAAAGDLLQLPLELRDPAVDPAAVDLELRLTRVPAGCRCRRPAG